MDLTVNSAVSSVLAMQQSQAMESAQVNLMKDTMDAQAAQVSQLMASVSPSSQLATEGTIGTRINTYA